MRVPGQLSQPLEDCTVGVLLTIREHADPPRPSQSATVYAVQATLQGFAVVRCALSVASTELQGLSSYLLGT